MLYVGGHDGLGLKKIIEKHIINFDDFDSIPEAINVITKVLENGRWINVKNDKIRIENGKYVVILQKSSDGVFVVSDYDNSRSPSKKARSESEKNKKRQEVFGMSRTSSLDSEGHLSLNNAYNNNTTSLENVNENQKDGNCTKEATDTIKTVIAQNSYALENSSIRQQVGAVIASINNNTSNIENVNNEHGNHIAMLGNDNAVGKYNVKPKNDKQN